MNRKSSTTDQEWPVFPIGPILVHYGGELPEEDRGWRLYKCPFHGDKTASASVNTTIHVFVCHTCDMKGGAVHIVMKKERLPYGTALRRTEEISGASNDAVRGEHRDGRRVSGQPRDRTGSRSFRRTWRRD